MFWLLEKILGIRVALADIGGSNPQGGGGFIIENPLGAGTTIETLLNRIIDFLAFQLGPVVAVGMIVYSAFLFITAGGNEDKIKQGKSALLYTLVGYGIILIAKGLILAIKELLAG